MHSIRKLNGIEIEQFVFLLLWCTTPLKKDNTLSLFRTNYYLFLPLNSVCLTRKQQISIVLSLVSSDRDSNSRATGLETSSLTIIPPLQLFYLPLVAKIVHGHICLRERNVSFKNNYTIFSSKFR
jgi:hypothetical protein